MSSVNSEKKEEIMISENNKKEKTKLLNKKRNRWESRNYMIKRLLAPFKESEKKNDENEYEKYANLYYLLMSFDWESLSQSKIKILQNLRPSSFWFYISSNYFPYLYNEFFDNKEKLQDIIQEFIVDKYTKDFPIKKNSPPNKKKKLLNQVAELQKYFSEDLNENSSIDDLITLCKKEINYIDNHCKNTFINNIQKNYNLTNSFNSNARINENLRMDMEYHSKDIKKFIHYLKIKNYDTIGDNEIDDEVCYVCNSGDYEDDNLIVYCSICNIAVHQQCYGIVEVPQEDWICNVCKKYQNPEKNKNVECILCSSKGGALKECNIYKSTNLLPLFQNMRKNPEYYLNKEKQKLKNDNQNINLSSNISSNVNSSAISKLENSLQSEKNEINENPKIEIEKSTTKQIFNVISGNSSTTNSSIHEDSNCKKSDEDIWVHLSCALWTPEVSINNFPQKEGILINDPKLKKRYLDKCDICLLQGYGPTVKCEKCDYQFHPECARQNKYPLEISYDNKTNESSFHIFCLKHAPYKFLKIRELKRQKSCDEIKQFGDLIKKSIDIHNKMDKNKNNILSVYNKTKGEKMIKDYNNKKIELSAIDKKNFYSAIKDMVEQIASLDSIEFSKEDYSIKKHKIDSKNIKYNYLDIKSPFKFPWALLKEKKEYLSNLKNYEIYQLFKDNITSSQDFCKLILNVPIEVYTEHFKNNQSNTNIIPTENTDYCKCHSGTGYMVECSGNNCIYNKWVHPSCFEELSKYDQETFDAAKDVFTYYCPSCREKEQQDVNFNILEEIQNKKQKSNVVESNITEYSDKQNK